MASWVCRGCTTAYTVGAPACPHCGSTDRRQEGDRPMLPMIQVACETEGCRAFGQVRSVRLPPMGSGLVQLPVIACVLCGLLVKTVTGLPLEGAEMPKITRHGGPTNYATRPERIEVTQFETEQPEYIEGAPPAVKPEPEPPEAEAEAEAQEPEAQQPEVSERPAAADRKDAWVAYAIGQGADPDEAYAATKRDLIAAYGEQP